MFPSLRGSFGSKELEREYRSGERFHPLEEVSEVWCPTSPRSKAVCFHPLEEVSEGPHAPGPAPGGPQFPSLRGSFGSSPDAVQGKQDAEVSIP